METADRRNVPIKSHVFKTFIKISSYKVLFVCGKVHFFGKADSIGYYLLMVSGKSVAKVYICKTVKRTKTCGHSHKKTAVIFFLLKEPEYCYKNKTCNGKTRAEEEP